MTKRGTLSDRVPIPQVSARGLWVRLASLTGVLVVLSVADVVLLQVRADRVGQPAFRFLIWNLFLAWIPYGLALALAALDHPRSPRPVLWLLGVAWLLFLPNAPYILTDFIHLGRAPGAPLWFDAALIGAFAGVGLVLGLASLFIVHRVVEARSGRALGWVVALGSLVLSAIGIYLGRFPRFNSWDVLTDPQGLVAVVLQRLADPLGNPFLVQFGLLMSVLLVGAYLLTWLVGRGLLGPVTVRVVDR